MRPEASTWVPRASRFADTPRLGEGLRETSLQLTGLWTTLSLVLGGAWPRGALTRERKTPSPHPLPALNRGQRLCNPPPPPRVRTGRARGASPAPERALMRSGRLGAHRPTHRAASVAVPRIQGARCSEVACSGDTHEDSGSVLSHTPHGRERRGAEARSARRRPLSANAPD